VCHLASSRFILTDEVERILHGISSIPENVMASAMEGSRNYDPTEQANVVI
jgi:hypothetical protein